MLRTWIARLVILAAAFIASYIAWLVIAEEYDIRNWSVNIAGLILSFLLTSTILFLIYQMRHPSVRATLLGLSIALLVFVGIALTRFWEKAPILHVPCPPQSPVVIGECGASVRPPTAVGNSILFGVPIIAGILTAALTYRSNRREERPVV